MREKAIDPVSWGAPAVESEEPLHEESRARHRNIRRYGTMMILNAFFISLYHVSPLDGREEGFCVVRTK